MVTSNLSLRELEYIVAVGELLHFGKAAIQCHVSQPALSGQIKKVEDLLGVQLFERSNRKVSTTPVGKVFISQARVVLEEAKKLEDISAGQKEPLSGELKLGAIATLGPYYLPHLIGPLQKEYPKLKLYVSEGLTDSLLERLKVGELDVILASPTFNERGFRVVPVFLEPFFLLAPKAHPLSSHSPIRPADLKAGEMVLLEDGHCLKDQTLQICHTNRRGNIRPYHATSIETLKSLVATGHGYTLIPALATQADSKLKPLLQYRPIAAQTGHRPLGRVIALVCRDHSSRMTDIDLLAKFIRDHIPAGCLPINTVQRKGL